MSYTPGSWVAKAVSTTELGRHDDNRWFVECEDGLPVIAVVEQYRGETERIARLIAAAPDLLAALQWVIDYAPTGADAARCRAAIAKAVQS